VVSHDFTVGQKVWHSDTTAIGKIQKLTPKWISKDGSRSSESDQRIFQDDTCLSEDNTTELPKRHHLLLHSTSTLKLIHR
jgi:hypothetical protein